MEIKTLQDLKETILACRKLGVDRIKVGEVEFHLGLEPVKTKRYRKETIKPKDTTMFQRALNNGIDENTSVLPNEVTSSDGWDKLTDEQKLFWSSTEEPIV